MSKNIQKKTKDKKKDDSFTNKIINKVMNSDNSIRMFLVGLLIGLSLFYIKDINRVTKLKDGEDLVVTAKGIKMTNKQLYDKAKEQYAINILIDEIDSQLLKNLYPETKDMKEKVDEQVDSIKEQTGENFLNTIKQYYGFNSEKELRSAILLSFRREEIAKKYIKKGITDKEIKKYYDDEVIGDIKAKHILIKIDLDENDDTEEAQNKKQEAAKKEAINLIKKLEKGGDFSKLAKKHSQDEGSAKEGGDLGYFNKGDMVPEFEEAVLNLKDGEYTEEPVLSQYGYHIILREKQKDKIKLDTMKKSIIEILLEQKLSTGYANYHQALIDFRKDNKLDIIDGKLKGQYENLKTTWLKEEN